jgi:hypothetical protein
MNEVNEIINIKKASCREFDANELMSLLKSKGWSVFASWGAEHFTVDKKNYPTMFRMQVNGHHHKGHVYIFLSFLDLFDVYLTKKDGTIVQKVDGLFFDQLVDWIDEKVERIPEYTR